MAVLYLEQHSMVKRILCYCQFILPQHAISTFFGWLANTRNTFLKNLFIKIFCHLYPINLNEAVITDLRDYSSFNDFFTRHLKPGSRTIDHTENSLVSPADGMLAQFGHIEQSRLIQAKNMYFSLDSLFANQRDVADMFINGHFATIYLAPHNYHRVHMPLTGRLIKSIYVPGRLFSVNRMTSQLIPNLYARNERLVCLFETAFGTVAVILVGALIVGSIQTIWMKEPIRSHQIEIETPTKDIRLEKGDELGHFQVGSTVIILMQNKQLQWITGADNKDELRMGQILANISLS